MKAKRRTFAQHTSAIDDATGPLGIRLVIQTQDETLRVRNKRPTLVFPLEAAIVQAGAATLDRSAWLLIPAHTSVVLSAKSLVAQTVLLSLSDALVTSVVDAYAGDIDSKAYARYLATAQTLPRTNWVNEVCHRYLFERASCKRRDNAATRFLEMEFAKELYFSCHESTRPSVVVDHGQVMQTALGHIEAHLFDANVIAGLAKASGSSASTLLRTFKRELGVSPLAYLRTRRLDEALLLLKSGRYTVGEVSMRIGYQNLSAFSSAFRQRFGFQPSRSRNLVH